MRSVMWVLGLILPMALVLVVMVYIEPRLHKVHLPFSIPSENVGHPLVQIEGHEIVDAAKSALTDPLRLHSFTTAFENRPFKANCQGIKINHAFAIWEIVKMIKPRFIIESGVNAGMSTYFFRAAAPDAVIISIDPLDEPLPCPGISKRWIDTSSNGSLNQYWTGRQFTDFAHFTWHDHVDPSSTLVFFDDHQNATNRIPLLQRHGFRYAIFEDNYKPGEGDLEGWSLKQVLGRTDFSSSWVRKRLRTYVEIPPLFPPLVHWYPKELTSWWDRYILFQDHECMIHNTIDGSAYPRPLLDPEALRADLEVLRLFESKFGMDPIFTNFDSSLVYPKAYDAYAQFMMYCHIAFVEVEPAI